MEQLTHTQRILDYARARGIVRSSELSKIGAPRIALTRLTASGHLERIGRGLYRLPDGPASENEGLEAITRLAPKSVLCLLSALQFHELTTVLPREVWIAMPRGSHVPRLDFPPIRMVQFAGTAYSDGIELHERGQLGIRVYGVAKTIADCFKYRHKIGLDVALEALKQARQSRRVTVDAVWHSAQICRVTNVMRPYLEALE